MNNLIFIDKLKYIGKSEDLLYKENLWVFVSLTKDIITNEIKYILKPIIKSDLNMNRFFDTIEYVVSENTLINDFIGIDENGIEIKIVENVDSIDDLIPKLSSTEINNFLSKIKAQEIPDINKKGLMLSEEQIKNIDKLDLNKIISETFEKLKDISFNV